MKQTLLTDIELDIQELKCLVNAVLKEYNPMLCEVAKRNVSQMRSRLGVLYEELNALTANSVAENQNCVLTDMVLSELPEKNVSEFPVCQPAVMDEKGEEFVPMLISDILRADLRHSISLNDSFRFIRELFDGDSEKMNSAIRTIDRMDTLDEALSYLNKETNSTDENEAYQDFVELLKKRFN